ncbi:TRAP transporter permease [Marinicrinis sediminis]|uniref:TRAP transporter permease n=1 Tax=Marinicrinis sediminis TaxID=1652465 RepID=A0ABW5RA05_9BACL
MFNGWKAKSYEAADMAKLQQKIDELEGSDRQLSGYMAKLVVLIALGMSVFHIWTAGFGVIPEQGLVHLLLALILTYLIYPYKRGSGQTFIPWYDLLLTLLACLAGWYMLTHFKEMASRSGDPTGMDIVIALIIVMLVLEATRRVLGLPLVILVLVFMAYALIGYRTVPFSVHLIPTSIIHAGYEWQDLLTKLNTDNGIFGMPIYVSSTYVFIFILFGAFFEVTGAGRMFIHFALSLLGSFRGGPAKAAVVGSGMMGSISGSSVANVVTTGTFTIPLMKKVGFASRTAGGIEVAASSSGQLLPPVMGAAAFIMAETTGIPYWDIAKSAIIPSILAYLAILVMVHIEALKRNIQGLPKSELSPLRQVLSNKGFLFLPIIGLIYYLSQSFTPTKAAYIAIVMIVLLAWFVSSMERRGGAGFGLALIVVALAYGCHVWFNLPMEYTTAGLVCLLVAMSAYVVRRKLRNREPMQFGFMEGLAALELGARNAIGVAIACAAAGILTGVVTMTGLGSNLSNVILSLSQADLFLGIDPIYPVLLFAMVASMILGMGLPTTATYIVLSAVMAPPLVEIGLSLMAAHLFVFYYGILADDTPPINLPAYAAAGIAKSEPVQTGLQGFKYDAGALLLPFAFALNPHLLLQVPDASWYVTAWAICTAMVGIIAFTTFIQNYMLRPLYRLERLLVLASALLLLHASLWTDLTGMLLMALVYARHRMGGTSGPIRKQTAEQRR